MTKETLRKAEDLRDKITHAESYLRYIKHYEQNLFNYKITITLPRTLGTFAINDDLYFANKQLKKDLLNTIKIYLVKEIQELEEKLKQL